MAVGVQYRIARNAGRRSGGTPRTTTRLAGRSNWVVVGGLAALLVAPGCSGTVDSQADRSAIQRVVTTAPTSTAPLTTTTTAPLAQTVPPVPTVPIPPAGQDPPPAWIADGVPQAGSMFRDLQADGSLAARGPVVALTFDDGPTQYTPTVLNILKMTGVQATFFQVVRQSVVEPDMVRSMAADGMRIGAHTMNHPRLNEVAPDVEVAEVHGSIDRLTEILGPGTVKCFRPPYGRYNDRLFTLTSQRSVATAMWSVDSRDWQGIGWEQIVANVLGGVRDRSVVLLHDGGGDRNNTILALPWIIQGLKDRGFQIIPIC